jgi:RNA polymerase sigma-32 factor
MSLRKSINIKNPITVLNGSGDSLQLYYQSIASIPILSHEDELVLTEKYHEHGDLEAAQSLVLAHLRFVAHIARSYKGYGLNMADLIQEGNIGLMKAVKRFDPAHGVRLISFAVHWIRAEMHEYIIKNWRLVKVATTKAQRKLFFNLRKAKSNLGWLTAEETKNVAQDLGVKIEEVTEMERRMASADISFDPSSDDDDEDYFSPASYLHSHDANPAQLIEHDNLLEDHQEQLKDAFLKLDERSRDILKRRWLQEGKPTLHDLADEYAISAERVRQIENNAILKLRKLIAQ